MTTEHTSIGVASLGQLIESISTYLSDDDVVRVKDAYRLADEAHLGQFRSSGEPYISHPIAVAETCASWHLDTEAIMAALLHDVLEDTGINKQTLIERFGMPVAQLVDGLSKLDKIEFQSREQAQAENFRKMLLAMASDIRVILVKLADRLHNMRTLEILAPYKRRRIARETLDIYAPIARRLGLNNLSRELEALSLKGSYPWRYHVLVKAIKHAKKNRRDVVGNIVENIQQRFSQVGIEAEVQGREKSVHSVYQKMHDKDRRLSFADIHDIFGFRIIVKDFATCYHALGIVHSIYKPVPGRFKDYIAIPKNNNYQSLHTTLVGPHGIQLELQIRTHDMHQIAENGVAAHWIYKNGNPNLNDLQKHSLGWLQSLLTIENRINDPADFLEYVKVDLFPDEVYVFTPRGKILALPRGATALDFAYYVHTDVGNHAMSCQIDNHPSPLNTVLRSGMTVYIATSPSTHPSSKWLRHVKTGRARAEIKHYLRNHQQQEATLAGQRLFEQAYWPISGSNHAPTETVWQIYLKENNLQSIEQFYTYLTTGNLIAGVAAKRLYELSLQRNHIQPRSAPELLAEPQGSPFLIQISGHESSSVNFSNCCFPIPGDAIIGNLKGTHSLGVHQTDCVIARKQQAKNPDNWVALEWSHEVVGLYKTRIEVMVHDRVGALAALTRELAQADSNIIDLTIDNDHPPMTTVRFTCEVSDRKHLANLLRSLRKVSGVTHIQRYRQHMAPSASHG